MTDAATNFFGVTLAWAITPAFFWSGMLLVALPILIHLLNRRRFKVVPWAAMEYLLAALRKNRRRIKFEQLLLLVTRCAILALLGLALARPVGCAGNSLAALAGQRSALHIFVIDNSYSMAYEGDHAHGRTHLEQAKYLVKQQIDQLAGGSESVVIIAAARGARITPTTAPANDVLSEAAGAAIVLRPSFDLDAAKAAVDRLEQSYGGTDIPAALQAAIQVARDEKRQPQKYLYVMTDFTRATWETPVGAEALQQIGRELHAVFASHVRLHDLGTKGQWNYSVLDLKPDTGLVSSTFHTDFLANVKGFGGGAETLVQWRWDDQVLPDTTRLKPDPNTEWVRQTKVQTAGGGAHVLSVSLINDEKLKIDNTRYCVVKVASDMKVLIVEGSRGTGLLSGSGAYLDLSLAPKKEIGPDGAVRSSTYVLPEVVSDLELNNKVLADYRAVILTNVGALSANQADQVRRFVEQGGTLMIFMGEEVNADAYNSVLLPRHLLPGKLIGRKSGEAESSAFTFDFSPNNPPAVLDIFRGEEKSGLDTGRIFTYYQMELDPQAKSEVVLRYLSGDKPTNDPAIVMHTLDKGHIVTFTTSADAQWNALPPKPAYIPLIHELLSHTVDGGDRWMNLTVGQPLVIPSSVRLTGSPSLIDSARKPIPVDAATSESGQPIYVSKPLAKPGLYSLSIGNESLPITVNVPSDGADIRLVPPETVRQALGGIELEILGDTTPASALARDEDRDFGWTLMVGLLALVGLECFMAMEFGHYKRMGSRQQAVVSRQ